MIVLIARSRLNRHQQLDSRIMTQHEGWWMGHGLAGITTWAISCSSRVACGEPHSQRWSPASSSSPLSWSASALSSQFTRLAIMATCWFWLLSFSTASSILPCLACRINHRGSACTSFLTSKGHRKLAGVKLLSSGKWEESFLCLTSYLSQSSRYAVCLLPILAS